MATKDWTKTRGSISGRGDVFWKSKDKLVTVGQSLGDRSWFVFIDPGKKFKVRIERARSRAEAIKFAKAYMRTH